MIVLIATAGAALAQTQSGCTLTFPGNYSADVNFADVFNMASCPSGDVIFENFTAKNTGGSVTFDSDVTFNSLTINFANGEKPADLNIPFGVTVNITNDLTFVGQPDKDKFMTVEGSLIVGETIDFGGVQFEIDGTGSIDARDIIGAGDVTCSPGSGGTSTCPTITTESCEDDPPGVSTFCEDPSVLPIELGVLTASVYGNSVVIDWTTLSEINNDFFTIEKSNDGINYNKLAMVAGAGNSDQVLSYSYTDRSPAYGRTYYRLKQTDYDGTTVVSGITKVEFSSLESGRLTFTNPVEASQIVTISVPADASEMLNIVVFDMMGKVVLSDAFSGSAYEFGVRDVKPGIYFIKVTSINQEQSGRLIVR